MADHKILLTKLARNSAIVKSFSTYENVPDPVSLWKLSWESHHHNNLEMYNFNYIGLDLSGTIHCN